MSERAKITVARFNQGVAVQVDGAGTMSESPVVYAFAEEILKTTDQQVIVNLAACTYLEQHFPGWTGRAAQAPWRRPRPGSRFTPRHQEARSEHWVRSA